MPLNGVADYHWSVPEFCSFNICCLYLHDQFSATLITTNSNSITSDAHHNSGQEPWSVGEIEINNFIFTGPMSMLSPN